MTVFDYLALIPLLFAAKEDLRRRIIPDWTACLLIVLSLGKLVLSPDFLASSILGFVSIGGLFLTMAVALDGIGGGDIKLCAALGLLLGVPSCWGILVISLCLLLMIGLFLDAKALPFAPCVCLAYFFQVICPILLQGVVIDVSL